jgi:hypothetical protein
MAAKNIGVGVIGVGMGSTMFPLNKIADSPFVVRGIASQHEERLKALDAQWGFGFCTTDYRKLIERQDIQVIGVYSPDHLHYEHCKAAQAGKHAVRTKPDQQPGARQALVAWSSRQVPGRTDHAYDPQFAGQALSTTRSGGCFRRAHYLRHPPGVRVHSGD